MGLADKLKLEFDRPFKARTREDILDEPEEVLKTPKMHN